MEPSRHHLSLSTLKRHPFSDSPESLPRRQFFSHSTGTQDRYDPVWQNKFFTEFFVMCIPPKVYLMYETILKSSSSPRLIREYQLSKAIPYNFAKYIFSLYFGQYLCVCRSQWPRGVRPGFAAARLLGLRVRIPQGYGCLSLVSVVCCQVEVSATGWSLVQRSPT
jgi:hypothetical protein